MFEDTNQIIETNETVESYDDDFSDIFSDEDFGAEPDTDGSALSENDPAGSEGEISPEENSADTKPEMFTVRFNGEDLELSREELIKNAQKGLNYDHVLQQRDELRNSRELQILDRFAKESGLTREQYLDELEKMAEQRAVEAEMNNGVPEDAARQLVRYRKAEAEAQGLKAAEQLKTEEKQRRQQEIAEFVKEYPEVKEFPQEVLDKIAAGESPLTAYRAYENRELKVRLAAMEQNAKNRKTSVGSMKGDGAGGEVDDFLSGFLGG